MSESPRHDVTTLGGLEPLPPIANAAERIVLGGGQALRLRDHAALIYWEPDELMVNVVPYLQAGLRCGDKVVYVAHDVTPERIRAALQAAGVDVPAEERAGRLVVLRAEDAFFPDGRFDVERALAGVQALARQAAADGFARVRFSVEMTYLLAPVPGMEHGPEFEARANDEVFARFPFVCVCSFNGSRDVNNLLDDVLQSHPVLISNGIPLRNPLYRPWPPDAAAPGRAPR